MSLAGAPRVPDRYELLRELGRGGMGKVYLARDRRLDRHVAIKVLDCATPGDLERFRREALAAGRLRSHSIVKIHELDECDGRPYLVMEYVDGGSLAERELEPGALLAVMREVAAALAHAHEQGIVHRDLKPANILLDAGGRAHLTDFGLARSAMAALEPGAGGAGAIVGTPYFMSPEQARGEPGDARSDVFSFGVTLYCKLARRQPFAGRDLGELLPAILDAEPAPLQDPRLPPALPALVMRCLAKAPAQRYQSMREVLRDLGRIAGALDDAPAGRGWFGRVARKITGRGGEADPHEAPGAEATSLDRDMIDRQVYGVGSHVHVLDALGGLDTGKAGARVAGAPHTIFQIVDHMLYWERIAHARIHLQPHEPPARAAEGWIERAAPVDDQEWQRTVASLAEMLRTLEQTLPVALEPGAYEAGLVDRVRRNLHMVITHNSYHVGQIVVLRQVLGTWPPPRGGDTW